MAIDEKKLIVKFLRQSADTLFGIGAYGGSKEYSLEAIHWMSEGIELAAKSIEEDEHLEKLNF